jgi:hypothetical protein
MKSIIIIVIVNYFFALKYICKENIDFARFACGLDSEFGSGDSAIAKFIWSSKRKKRKNKKKLGKNKNTFSFCLLLTSHNNRPKRHALRQRRWQ